MNQRGKKKNKQAVTQQGSELEKFDVVIIGGGIVGLCFANELIDSDFSVAIIY